MGKCKYCGKDVGLFSTKHKECEEQHENGIQGFDSWFVVELLSMVNV